MTKYECDRCGKQTTDSDEIGLVTYYGLDYRREMDKKFTLTKELCSSCMRDINDYMKPLPKEMSK